MAHAQFPQVPDLILPTEKRIGDGVNLNFGKWDVANPHPNFGKDPNIGNEYGHTHYPKVIYKEDKTSVVVNNAGEEAIAKGEKINDGPTIKEWVDAGYKASAYPPHGYEPKSSQEEVEAAIAKEIEDAQKKLAAAGWGSK